MLSSINAKAGYFAISKMAAAAILKVGEMP
jgi:hypothetical protein